MAVGQNPMRPWLMQGIGAAVPGKLGRLDALKSGSNHKPPRAFFEAKCDVGGHHPY